MTDFGIYIHWPFCLSKCPYCDFFSKVKSGIDQADIIKDYLADIDFYAGLTADRTVTSIFFGGGTPSLLQPQHITSIIDRITTRWKLAPEVEISLEANPGSNSPTLFKDLKSAGVNRLSLGVQALNSSDLKFLGRKHSLAEALKALEQIVSLFDNHSADLIYARPNQKLGEWQQELEQITSFGLKHLSLYQLTIEPGTVFYKQGVQPLEEDAAAAIYEQTARFLTEKGYPRYEVSNHARPGFACRHNLLYWQGGDYVGIGQAAHGRLTLDGCVNAVTHRRQFEPLTSHQRAEELLLMGLRLTEGINKAAFQNFCGLELDNFLNRKHLTELVANGYLIDSPTHLAATERGFNVLNFLIEQLAI